MNLNAILCGFLLDFLIGDPHWLYHPVRLIGRLIEWLEHRLRKSFAQSVSGERQAGTLLVILIGTVTTAVVYGLLKLSDAVHPLCGFVVETVLCYQLFAVRSLKEESMRVFYELEKHDLPAARKAVSMIVGRDTAHLTAQGVTKAAVETIAENTSDGTLAPMFYLFLGGPLLGWFYKAVNTMDSMVGYKNDQYLNFGRAAARLDDVMNFLPARICAWLMIAASAVLGMDFKNAKKIFFRDRFEHASPNSAQTEAVMAGALRIQLAGDAWYFGKRCEKPTIGDDLRPVEAADIRRANRLLYMTAILAFAVFGAIRFAFEYHL